MMRNAFWSGLEAAVSATLSVLASFLVARIIGSAELGIGAAATAVHVVLWVAVNALFADALVQQPEVDQRALSSAFWASVGVGAVAMAVQGVAGLGLAGMLGDPRLLSMSLLLALPLPLVGGAGVVQGLLTRKRAYCQLALRTLIGQGSGTFVGVLAALHGAGAWSLVLQQAVTSFIGAAALLLCGEWIPAARLDVGAVRRLLRVGVPLTASTLVLIARYRLFAVLIGGFAGPAVLGQVHLAFRLVDTLRELAFTALWRLMLPSLAEAQHDRYRLLARVDQWQRWCLAVLLPLCAVLAAGLAHIVSLVMGPAWQQAGQAALPLVVLMAISVVMFPSGVALVALGQARFALFANLGSLVLACAAVPLWRPADPWHAVLPWVAAQLLVVPYSLRVNSRALRVGWLRPLTGGFRIFARP